jgi:hypothetical protein
LWGSDLFIDTEPNINNIVRKTRTAVGDDPATTLFLASVLDSRLLAPGSPRLLIAVPAHLRAFPGKDVEASKRARCCRLWKGGFIWITERAPDGIRRISDLKPLQQRLGLGVVLKHFIPFPGEDGHCGIG